MLIPALLRGINTPEDVNPKFLWSQLVWGMAPELPSSHLVWPCTNLCLCPSDPRSLRRPQPCCCTSIQESFLFAGRVCQAYSQIQVLLAGCNAKGQPNTGTYLLHADGCKPESRQVNPVTCGVHFPASLFYHWRKDSVTFMACTLKSKGILGRGHWKTHNILLGYIWTII